ncbi:MAG TPA: iron-containing alcohol dehydrogenase [Magnetospirillaceae bacterium]|nr:iron-containing alcohol dehydrogenase [Magnetospirillaceae bacterium]
MYIRHAGYRAFQTALRLTASFLSFRPPELLEGPGSLRRLPVFIKSKGFDRVLVVTDAGVRAAGLPDALLQGLDAEGIAWTLYDGVRPNPTIGNVEEARALYKSGGCQAIVAFGGGSSLDCGKACAAVVANPKRSVPRMRGLFRVVRRPAPLFAVPTTAGTGSEATVAAVIVDTETREKYSITDTKLIPKWAVLDPELTLSLPPHITAATGMDALTHAVEAYVGRSNTEHTRAMAEEAVSLVFANLETAYRDGRNLEARTAMLRAAFCGGVAFTRAYVGYTHAIAHQLGGLYGVPHGLANTVVLPYVLDFFGDSAAAPLARLAAAAGLDGLEVRDETGRARAFIRAIRDLNARMAIPDRIDAIREEDIPLIVRRALSEAHPLYPVPRFMDASDCEAVVRRAWRGVSAARG